MIDAIVLFLIAILPILLGALFLVKLSLFVKIKRRVTAIFYFFYFPQMNVYLTDSNRRRKLKLVQNTLSAIVLLISFSYVLLLFIIKN